MQARVSGTSSVAKWLSRTWRKATASAAAPRKPASHPYARRPNSKTSSTVRLPSSASRTRTQKIPGRVVRDEPNKPEGHKPRRRDVEVQVRPVSKMRIQDAVKDAHG